ncbi:DUF1902 domain-containing protein [Bradyrhizobium sp. HKCCYLRH2060]|uniref:DUF1902 domain-containing protein n=1 Tax=Bradyrhizobium TaxID=374 RepID=UPI0029169D77|nr:DUF1902 domain-containing protein [Bradyrhizobium sp. SZCCHNR3003]
MSTIVVRATWDREASYRVAESLDVLGLATGAATLKELAAKLPGIIQDLLESPDNSDLAETEIPIEIIASITTKVRGYRSMKSFLSLREAAANLLRPRRGAQLAVATQCMLCIELHLCPVVALSILEPRHSSCSRTAKHDSDSRLTAILSSTS